jgi:uncharacterized membrane protein HdeD (DUF308 family)
MKTADENTVVLILVVLVVGVSLVIVGVVCLIKKFKQRVEETLDKS